MATVGTYALTLSDWARRLDPQGQVDAIVEIMKQTNGILEDMIFVEGNLPTGHKFSMRSGLPSGTWRQLNYGVQPEKSRTVQVTDTCGMLESYAQVDKDLADLNGNTREFMTSEEKSFVFGLSNTMATTVFYGNTATDPKKFMGLTPRYNSTSAENAVNIINGGGSGSTNTSIWLNVWGDQTLFGIFPKGKKAGLQRDFLGEVTLTDDQTPAGLYQGYRTHFKWDIGLCLKDWQYVVRICNVDVALLVKDASSGADLVDLMMQATECIPALGVGRAAFYCNKTIRSYLRRQITRHSKMNLTWDTVAGKRVLAFDEIPVVKCDALLNTEDAVA